MSYRRRSSPLHSARASAGCAYCLGLAVAALIVSNPVALGAIAVAVLGAGLGARVGRELWRAALLGLPLAATIAVINALVSRNGLTVIVRLGDLPLLGHTDVTLEATVYGAVLGLRAVTVILCGVLYTTAVDPDEVLRLFRRVSFRSALTATLATRMVPVLIRDSHRLADAQRCRPGRPPSRVALMRAAGSSVLDRALDVAAALEVRGYGVARRPAAPSRLPTRATTWRSCLRRGDPRDRNRRQVRRPGAVLRLPGARCARAGRHGGGGGGAAGRGAGPFADRRGVSR